MTFILESKKSYIASISSEVIISCHLGSRIETILVLGYYSLVSKVYNKIVLSRIIYHDD